MEVRIIGCGAMGSAIAERMANTGNTLSLYDKHQERVAALACRTGATIAQTPLGPPCQVIIIAVKPQDFAAVAEEIKEFKEGLIVSILTGVSQHVLQKNFKKCTVLRMMPNLAVRYGEGVVALAEDSSLELRKQQIQELFSPLGQLHWLDEKHFDAITALTGSGPAFVLTLIESMVDAAIALGFSAETGYALVKQMLAGTMAMLNSSQDPPAAQRLKICSPAGTTIAGMRTLERFAVRSALLETFLAAAARSKEMGN